MLNPITRAEINEYLSSRYGSQCHIETVCECYGGDIHQAYQLHTRQGNFFVKLNDIKDLPLFITEAHSLNRLAETLSIQVPKVIGVGSKNTQNNQAWLLLEYLELRLQGDDEQRGKDLALLHHQVNQDKKPFGWFEDNYIGHNLQKNAWQADWVTFYGRNRLAPQLQMADKHGASQKLLDLGGKLIEKLPNFFQDYQPEASPLHGDLWNGNSAFLPSGEAVFFDPASYYGDRETDLAMTELFGGFSPAFYQGYQSVFPIHPGYPQRKKLYNLYHILNHFNLFGGGYQQQALNLLTELTR